VRDGAPGTVGHFGRSLDQCHTGRWASGGDRHPDRARAGAEIGELPGEARGHRGGEHHRVHAGAMAAAGRLNQMEGAAMKGVERPGLVG
jgi:hypothetical protein